MSGGVSIAELETALSSAFTPTTMFVDDMSDGCGAKFDLVIVSDKFSGVSLLDRQRRSLMKNANEEVNEAIKPFMDRIHAVTMKCLTPAQFETRKDSIMAARQN